MTAQVRDVKIPVGEISLEAKLGYDARTPNGPGVVICHPHPQFGGSMENNVVWALCDAFVERGYRALAFNFRGVGSSGGRHEDGEGEILDVLGVLDWLEALPETKGFGLGILGYSFGAWVGLRAAARDARVLCAGAVAPPLAMYSFSFLKDLSVPLFVVSGGQDAFCPSDGREALCSELPKEVNWKILEGADHFFWNCEKEAAGYLADGFQKHLLP
jgi:alpha/beta superfamily hydrolase